SFPRPAGTHARTLAIIDALEHPEDGIAAIVDALVGAGVPFDVFLMLVAERALVFHGVRDPGAVMAALERIYREGFPWLGQSCLYVASKVLETVPVADTQPAWLDAY